MEFAPWPFFAEDEIEAAVTVLRSGNVNQWTGNEVQAFENEFAGYIGAEYGIALANGSLALDLALTCLNIKRGDEVIVTPRTFIASASCITLKNAVPVFIDVDRNSQNITLQNIARAVTPKTKAVIAVHLAGWPCEMTEIQKFCKEENIFLIEDCAQSHGAMINGKKTGSFGDFSVFSFCQDKIMTTGGEGGMLLTSSRKLWEKAWSYKDHGKDFNTVFKQNHPPGFRWFVKRFGTNFRLTEMQAAMGRVMLNKLDKWVEIRRQFATILTDEFKNTPGLRVTIPEENVYHSYYKYYVFINLNELKKGWDRNKIITALNEMGIQCETGICPEVYNEAAFKKVPFKIISGSNDGKQGKRLPAAKQLGETSLMLKVHPTLDEKAIRYVAKSVRSVMENSVK